MYTLELGVFMYRFSISDLPVAFKEYLKRRSEIHEYPTRHVNDLNLTNNKKFFGSFYSNEWSQSLELIIKNIKRIQNN